MEIFNNDPQSFYGALLQQEGHAVAQWGWALCYKPGTIADGVTEILHWHNPSGRTMGFGWLSPWELKGRPNNLHMPTG